MKKIRWIMAIRYMLRQKSACLSMFIVAMLAVTAYIGIDFSAEAMRNNAEHYWDRTSFRDIEIISPTLLTEEDISSIADTKGVKDVEAVWYTEASAVSTKKTGVDVVSLTERINTVSLKEGRMPETADECLLEEPVLKELGLSVGDTIELEPNPTLVKTSFTVCGVAEHADHPCAPLNVPGNRYAIVLPEAFDIETLQGCCMKAVVRVEGTEGISRFSGDYLENCGLVCTRLNNLSEKIAQKQRSSENIFYDLLPFMNSQLTRLNVLHPWLVLDVWGSSSYYAIYIAAENTSDIAVTFAVAFVIVGAFVIYASISRMVEEDRKLIGTAKAMGETGKEIAFKYLMAGMIPTAAGMMAGISAGYAFIQPIVLSSSAKLYTYGKGQPVFRPVLAAVVFAAGILISAAAAVIACADLLREPAIRLMNYRDRASGLKEKVRTGVTKGVRGASFSVRMILRSIRTGKRRFLVIVVGITGCMILMVTGFTIKLSVTETLERQYTDIEIYDLKIVFDRDTEDGGKTSEDQIISVLTDAGVNKGTGQEGWIEVSVGEFFFQAGGRMNGGELICGSPEELPSFYVMEDVKSGKKMEITSEPGLYIHLRTSETSRRVPGDHITLYDMSANRVRVPVAGVFNNYLGGQMIMSDSSYESLFEKEPEHNCFLVKCGKERASAIAKMLEGTPVNVIESTKKQDEYKSFTSVMNLIAGVLTGIAALMAGGVLLNLIYLQYYRKKRSLIVMRINGFTTWETAGYVLGESVATHVLGIIFGIIGGAWFGHRVICLVEGRQLHIIRSVQPLAWLLSVVIMLLFSVVIHAVIVHAVVRLKPTEDVMIR